ncbi:hypothetical protein [Bordetella genomosp. 13]|uniref:hypothetical protein n=1 Tax=Bordetella genomosp. 13 TaxID=463040 RepID=UPI0011A27534|nr:hypothetical protein [Bordetella genomosp. 13]
MTDFPPLRQPCPPGACDCGHDALRDDPAGDKRILMLTKAEEKKLVERLESVATLEELRRMEARIQSLLGVTLTITPSDNEVRTMRGFNIRLEERPGLCSKTRQSIPAAIRRCFERNPDIAFAILNESGLLRDA